MSRSRLVRVALALAGLAGLAAGTWQLVNASTFQLFGDYVARVDTTDRVVAVTFDDGPHPQYTPQVLDVLDRHGVKATFFMMGRNVERFPAVAADVVGRGHEVGNHSYSHPRLVLMRPSRVRAEIERTDTLLRGIGVTGPIHFRAPHAAKLIVLPAVLSQMNKLSVLGDVDPEEWRRPPAAVITEDVLRRVRPGSIIWLHDTLGVETVRALDAVLTTLAGDGYRFETISELIGRR